MHDNEFSRTKHLFNQDGLTCMGSHTFMAPLSCGTRSKVLLGLTLAVVLVQSAPSAGAAAKSPFEVRHVPEQPRSGEQVTISVQSPAGSKDAALELQYQVVDPGKYIARADSAYTKQWTSVPLKLDASGGSNPARTT